MKKLRHCHPMYNVLTCLQCTHTEVDKANSSDTRSQGQGRKKAREQILR